MPQRILVTGGAGFIGSHVVDKLADAGHQPCIFDMVVSPFHDETLDTYVGELRDLAALTDAMRGCDTVMHLAPAAANRVYNLVGDEDTTILDIAQVISALVGDVSIVHGPSRVGDFRGAQVSGARASTDLDWTARTPFATGAGAYLSWYRAQHPQPDPLAT